MKIQESTQCYDKWRNVKKQMNIQKRLIVELEEHPEHKVEKELSLLRSSYAELSKKERNLIKEIISVEFNKNDLWNDKDKVFNII